MKRTSSEVILKILQENLSKECGYPLKAGLGKEMYFLEPP